MGRTLESYAYLWEDRSGRYALVYSKSAPDRDRALVYDTQAKSAIVIENDDLWPRVVQRMRESNCRVLELEDLQG